MNKIINKDMKKYYLPIWEGMALDRVFSDLQAAIDWVKQIEEAPLIGEEQAPEHPGYTTLRWWGTFGSGEEALPTHYHITEVIVVE